MNTLSTLPTETTATPAAKDAYTVKEIVKRYGISKPTLFREFKAGRLAKTKIGRKVIVLAPELQRWLAASTSAAPKAA